MCSYAHRCVVATGTGGVRHGCVLILDDRLIEPQPTLDASPSPKSPAMFVNILQGQESCALWTSHPSPPWQLL